MMKFYTGVVENRDDPLKIGRCQVRIVGLHTENKSILPTKDLPWAHPIAPITSASMNGIGWTPVGPVHGTWVAIVFSDEDQQQPLMLGTLPGIPQSKAAEIAVEESDDSVIVTDGGILTDQSGESVKTGDGNPIQVGTKEAQSYPPVTATSTGTTTPKPELTKQVLPDVIPQNILKLAIPTTPPPKSTSNSKLAEENIKHIINACNQCGFTSKYAIAGILAICGGESGWLLTAEDYFYTDADRLAKIFRLTFNKGTKKNPIPDPVAAKAYTSWRGSREDFFRKIYGPDGNGALVGHKGPDDGALYYGRGFNQITGKGLYTALQKFLETKGVKVDLVGNPNSLLSDPKIAALATVGFYAKGMTDISQDNPSWFKIALTRTGADAGGGYAKKEGFYDYFVGGKTIVDPTNKSKADDQKVYTKEEVKELPPAKQAALLEDRSSNDIVGFKDPSGKYPLRDLIDEPDTNRLARGIVQETSVAYKDSTRTKEIPAANGGDRWEQPQAPFGGMYPYAKIMETESGHVMAFDDTPNNEYISFYHRQGSFIDIDANGSQVNKIIGDSYQIIDRNGSIYITGSCNLSVGNSVNILVQGAADIQVDGKATINLNNHADIGVGGDLSLAVGGDIKVQANGTFDIQSAGFNVNSSKSVGIVASENLTTQAGKDIALKSTGGGFYADASKDVNIKAGGNSFTSATGGLNIKATGKVALDGSTFVQQSGQATAATGAGSTTPINNSLDIPDFSVGNTSKVNYLEPPVRPSPPVVIKQTIIDENNAKFEDAKTNPAKYENKQAAAAGVNPNIGAGTPKDAGNGSSLISGAASGDIAEFLRKQIELNKTSGYWKEDPTTKAGNQNILRMWTDLGFSPKFAPNDGVPWCMCFVQWTLKQCNYRYVQTGWAFDIRDKTSKWNATKVSNADAQPGDIALWSYGHVNFVYSRLKNGGITFVGGNQRPPDKSNMGEVNQNWVGGYVGNGDGSLIGVYRPSKT